MHFMHGKMYNRLSSILTMNLAAYPSPNYIVHIPVLQIIQYSYNIIGTKVFLFHFSGGIDNDWIIDENSTKYLYS